MLRESVLVQNAPAVPGLTFRLFTDEADYPAMVDIFNACDRADEGEEVYTVEGLQNDYAHLTNCDLRQDLLMADVDSKLVGFGRVWWWVNDEGERLYGVTGSVHPEWRGKGIGTAILQWQEQRARDIAATHPAAEPRALQVWVMEAAQARHRMFLRAGYEPIRYGYMMVRPALDDLPDAPMPAGVEVRPVLPEHMRVIWDGMSEAFKDHWGHRAMSEEDYQGWLGWPDMQPHLWQVAWDVRTNEVAGAVMSTIFPRENEAFGIKRGWTDPIWVRRPWRRNGLARALIIKSLALLKEQGMIEAALGVDAQNPNKALHLYESCGYEVRKRSFTLRKAL